MSRYVISDLHGVYELFEEILKVINFSSTDELYILGDIIDRGYDGLKIYDYIKSFDNIFLIKGNHEKMLELAFESREYEHWYYNGGGRTHAKILMRDRNFKNEFYNYVKNLPLYKIVDEFVLVHGGIGSRYNKDSLSIYELLSNIDEDVFLWDRTSLIRGFYYKDYKLIIGHSIVPNIEMNKNVCAIDCGCYQFNRLGCLNLDTKDIIYLSINKNGEFEVKNSKLNL